MRVIILLLLLCGGVFAFAQDLDPRIAKTKLPLSEVELVMMPSLDNDALLEAELERRGPGIAPQFAEIIEVAITPETYGHWETLDDGTAVWRLRIRSNDALSLNLGFTKYVMPTGGSLILYSPTAKHVMGPFTPADNEEHEQLWTPVFDGEELVVEVQLPTEERQNLQLFLKTVNHDYIGFTRMASVISGSCNLDVICSEADGWGIVDQYRDIIQSVAVIGTGGGTFCTGFLVNNASQDCTPFFMTANHCGIGAGNAPSLVAYWNYENSTCRQPNSGASGGAGDGTLSDFNTGSIFRAAYAPSDFTLVELDDPVSETANAFFAGWSAEHIATQDTTICIHHPSTDEKRISFEFDATYFGEWGQGSAEIPDGDHIIIPDWDIGTTEGGSSGSPLFDKDKRVVGQLHGGSAACGNNAYDSYGAMFASWEGGGTPSTRLKDWLDPDNTGVLTLDGRWAAACSFSVDGSPMTQAVCAPNDAVYEISVSENYLNDVTLSIEAIPAGATGTFGSDIVAPGGTTTLTISNTGALATGSYTISISGTDGTESGGSDLILNVSGANPGVASLDTPMDMEEGMVTNPTLTWMDLGSDIVYDVEIATDDAFTDVIGSETGLDLTSYNSPILATSSTYYWRVRGTNACGDGEWSTVFSFTTTSCIPAIPQELPIEITSAGTPTITSTLNLTQGGNVIGLRVVDLDILHSYIGDLYVTLTSPSGLTAVLIDRPGVPATNFGCGNDNIFVTFDDMAPNTAEDLENECEDAPAIEGMYQSIDPLSIFIDEPIAGPWTLAITDNADQDGGLLNSWGLDFCSFIPEDASLSVSTEDVEACINQSFSFDIQTGIGFDENGVTLSASGNPAGSTITYSENPAPSGSVVTVTVENIGMAGDYTISFSGTDGTNTGMVDLEVSVNGTPEAVNLTAPVDGTSNLPLGNMLSWTDDPESSSYQLQVATDMDFSNIVIDENTTSNSFNISGLEFNTTYFWRVVNINNCGEINSVEVFSFSTIPDLSFDASPNEAEVCQAESPEFTLSISQGFMAPATLSYTVSPDQPIEVSYDVDPDDVPSGADVLATIGNLIGVPTGIYTITFTIDDGLNSNQASISVNVIGSPALPDLVSPTNGVIIVETSPILDWNESNNATSYLVEVARDDAFTIIEETNTVNDSEYPIATTLESGTYFWRITANNECGAATTQAFSFTVQTNSTNELNGRTINFEPNPTSGEVSIRLSDPLPGAIIIDVFAVNGQRLQQQIFNNASTNLLLDLSKYPAGVYMVRLNNQDASLSRRIIVQ